MTGAVAGGVPQRMGHYRDIAMAALFDGLPGGDPPYLYELIPDYPRRPGKGLRAALCLATCGALSGRSDRAVNSAAAIELLHNAFLVHDDIQDESQSRRGRPTLHTSHGIGIAINVGNAMNLLALSRLRTNRDVLGPTLAWRILEETEDMMRHTLEGQALELAWIRDNACDLGDEDYYRMCLKKTSWYTCIYPCRVGAMIATEGHYELDRLYQFGWYLGAAFQIQDDVLNLVGDYGKYGKEIAGDLLEGKRTLMIIHALRVSSRRDRARIVHYLAKTRGERSLDEMRWLRQLLDDAGSITFAREAARRLAAAAELEAVAAFDAAPDSEDKQFLLQSPRYVIERDS